MSHKLLMQEVESETNTMIWWWQGSSWVCYKAHHTGGGGSRGMVDIADFAGVQEAVHAPEIDYIALCQQTIQAVILGSYSTWLPHTA